MGLEEGLDVALKALCKTLDTAQPTSKKIELMVIEKQGERVANRFISESEVETLLTKNKLVRVNDDL